MGNNIFKRVYTAKQLNRGEGMVFHPLTGERLSRLMYYRSRGTFARVIFIWDDSAPALVRYRRQIGERRKLYAYGDPYPSHWQYDPWTGERLRPSARERFLRKRQETLRFLRDYLSSDLHAWVAMELRGCALTFEDD